jgi:hypothetical protein
MDTRVTADAVVRACKALGTAHPAKTIAAKLGTYDSRAVATAARKPVSDGRLRVWYPKGSAVALYRFVRLTPKPNPAAAP